MRTDGGHTNRKPVFGAVDWDSSVSAIVGKETAMPTSSNGSSRAIPQARDMYATSTQSTSTTVRNTTMNRLGALLPLVMVLGIVMGCGRQTFIVPRYPNAENIHSTPFATKNEGGILYQTMTFTTHDSIDAIKAWYQTTLIDQGWYSNAEVMGLSARVDVRFGNTPMDQGIATRGIGLHFEEQAGKTFVTIEAIIH
jgi:hypothetical protein